MNCLDKAFFVASILVFLTCLTLSSGTIGANGLSYIQVIFKTEGDLHANHFVVRYRIGRRVETDYQIEFVMSCDNPLVDVDIHWCGNKTNVVFSQAKVTVFSSLFSMKNGSLKRMIFWDDPYISHFLPQISRKNSKEYLCSYSINLTSVIKEAKVKFANKVRITETSQSNLGARVFFETTGLDTILQQGRERRLEFIFQNYMANLYFLDMSVTIPNDCEFIGKPTLNDRVMNKILKRVEGDVAATPYELKNYKTIVEWRVPKQLEIWERFPFNMIISGLIGGMIGFGISQGWKWSRKPRITIGTTKSWTDRTGIEFYPLIVENNGKTTAYETETYISFKSHGGKKLFSLNGKWAGGPQPLGPLQKSGRARVWPALKPLSERTSLKEGDSERFCLVIKDSEPYCYAFNADSYGFKKYKNPQWRLPKGKFIAEVEVRADNAKKLSKFLVENKGNGIHDISITKLE